MSDPSIESKFAATARGSAKADPGIGSVAIFGWIVLLGGIGWMVYALFYSTTVMSSGGDELHNNGLLNNRLVHMQAGAVLVIVRMLMMVLDAFERARHIAIVAAGLPVWPKDPTLTEGR